jgi:hypothetical protein
MTNAQPGDRASLDSSLACSQISAVALGTLTSVQMPKSFTAVEQLGYATVRIECTLKNGDTSTGTGFFFAFATRDLPLHVPAIVTNKHVVEDAATGRLYLHLAANPAAPDDSIEPSGKSVWVVLDDFEARWVQHPDPDVDLCALPLAQTFGIIAGRGGRVYYVHFSLNDIATEIELAALTALDDVVMVGYPNGIWDSANNMPIFRKGVAATHPYHDYDGKREFLIDAACFPGSSGSPVLLFNQGAYASRTLMQIGKPTAKLLGVMYAGPSHTAEGEVKIVTIPTAQGVRAFSKIPNNLGLVIKASELRELDRVLQEGLDKNPTPAF